MRIHVSTLFWLALTASVTSTAVLAQTLEIREGGSYPPGARLMSPLTGISFQLPAGFQAEWNADLGGVLAENAQGILGGVWGWSEGTVEEVAEEVGRILAAQGIQIQLRGEPEVTQDGLQGVWDAFVENERAVLHGVVRRGERGGVVALAGLEVTSGAAPGATSFAESLASSLEWSEPGAAAWRQEVAGAVLTWGGGGSDISTGSTTATGASSSSATLSLCGLTQYRYQESSESYVSIPGASASSSSSDEHAGEWWLVVDLAGTPALMLDASDGRSFQWSVEESGDDFLIDGYRYAVTGQC